MSLMGMGFGLGKFFVGGDSPPARLCVTSVGDCPPKVKMNNELSQSPKCRDWLFYVGLGWILGEWSI